MFIDVKIIKNKFARLISYMYTECGIELSNITDKIIKNSFFDFLEENNTESFINTSYEDIIYQLYSYKPYINYASEIVSEILWACNVYLSISFNYNIPLRQLFLLISLKEMISYYPIYHELNDKDICDHFINNEYNKSIMKIISKEYSVKEISLLTGINTATLRSYENNNNLFKGSFSNIMLLSKALKTDISLFKKESSFIPYDRYLLEDKAFIYKLIEYLPQISSINLNTDNIVLFVNDKNLIIENSSILIFPDYYSLDEKEIRSLLKKHRAIYLLNNGCQFYKISSGKLVSYCLDSKYIIMVKRIINELIKENNILLF